MGDLAQPVGGGAAVRLHRLGQGGSFHPLILLAGCSHPLTLLASCSRGLFLWDGCSHPLTLRAGCSHPLVLLVARIAPSNPIGELLSASVPIE